MMMRLIIPLSGGLNLLGHPYIVSHWQVSITREPPKTEAELRQMLAEAIPNTPPKAKKNLAGACRLD
jgi:hypothetical protein